MTVVRQRDFVVALGVLAIGVGFLLWAQTYPPRASALPKLVGWITIMLALIDVVSQFDTPWGLFLRRVTGLDRAGIAGPAEPKSDPDWRHVARALLWVVGYLVVVVGVGFLIATPIYLFCYMLFFARKALRASAAAAVITTASIWLLFEVLFRYPLYPGMLFGGY
jgi:hypothetical protein